MPVDTKERILTAALELFAQNGFLGTSMSDIANQLQITKGALYKHYASKQEILDQIILRMNETDAARANDFSMPAEGESRNVTMQHLCNFALAQFVYWTQDPFANAFRRLLTIEQYRSEEMQQRYQQYLAEGQLSYVESIFVSMGMTDAREKALAFFAPLFLYYSLADQNVDTELLLKQLGRHFDSFAV